MGSDARHAPPRGAPNRSAALRQLGSVPAPQSPFLVEDEALIGRHACCLGQSMHSGVVLRMNPAGPAAGMAAGRLIWHDAGREHVFSVSGSHSIGRHPYNDLQLLDARVSKFHSTIEIRGSRFFLRDLGSFNGTWVNGHRVSGERQIAHGDSIAIGCSLLGFEARAPDARPSNDHGSLHRRFVGAMWGVLETRDGSALLSSVLRVAVDLFGADWGGLLELGPSGALRTDPVTVLPGKGSVPTATRIDVSLVDRALQLGHATLRVEWSGDAYRAAKPRTLIALPLVAITRALGVLWLERDGANERGPFAEIELLCRVAALQAESLATRSAPGA